MIDRAPSKTTARREYKAECDRLDSEGKRPVKVYPVGHSGLRPEFDRLGGKAPRRKKAGTM